MQMGNHRKQICFDHSHTCCPSISAARAFDFLESIFAVARPAGIVTWGITDRYTWVPMWYKRKDGLPNRPLPFDENYRPKPLWNVIDYFCQQKA